MTDSSDERLKTIAERRREDAEPRSRSRMLLLLGAGALFVLVAGALMWIAVAGVPVAEDSSGGLTARAMAWYLERQSEHLQPPGGDATPVAFEVLSGETVAMVGDRLAAEGLIRDADAFRLLARVRGLDTGIQAGAHVLRRNMAAEEVLAELQIAAADSVTVTIPEGWRIEEVADLLEAEGLVDRAEFLLIAGASDVGPRTFLDDRPEGVGLEGYLFPDTYQLEPEAGAQSVVGTLLDTFEARVAPEFAASGGPQGLSLYEVVTLASIVEREAVVDEERGQIARVFLNRLETPPYLLNADPTVQYALGFQPEANTWWKRPLYEADLQVDSAYNSYQVGGLPPGPIASPGLNSIRAVLDAPEGPWQYFVANDVACDGTHVFAETLDEHVANIAAYQTGDCGR